MRKVTMDVPTQSGRYLLKNAIEHMQDNRYDVAEEDRPAYDKKLNKMKEAYADMKGRQFLSMTPEHAAYLGLLKD